MSDHVTEVSDNEYSATLLNGSTWVTGDGKAQLGQSYNVQCNTEGGWAVYAIGSTTDDDTDRNHMIGVSHGLHIPTATNTTGDTSSWSFRIDTPEGSPLETFDTFTAIPNTWQRVVISNTPSINELSGSFSTAYQVYVSEYQAADTYTGKVTYTLVHPRYVDVYGNYANHVTYHSNTTTDTTKSYNFDPVEAPHNVLSATDLDFHTDQTDDNGDPYLFDEWNTSSDGTGDTYAVGTALESDTELYAIWKEPYSGLLNISGRNAGYKEVEYIESTGIQYINTGIVSSTLSADYQIELQSQGTRNPTNYAVYVSFNGQSAGAGTWIAQGRSGMAFYNTENASGSFAVPTMTKVVTKISDSQISFNDEIHKMNSKFTRSGALHIFGTTFPTYTKLWYFKVWSNGELLRDLIPVVKNGTYGLWDNVTNQFYGNAGSGSFTGGTPLYD